MGKLRRPHIVPRGYQRNFADGERISVIDKETLQVRTVGTRDNFVVAHFLRVIVAGIPNDDIEDEFARIESFSLPRIRQLRPFTPITPDQEVALKATTAMLWARSYSREIVAERIFRDVVDEHVRSAVDDEDLLAAFRSEMGRDPEPGELERLYRERADEMRRQRVNDVNQIISHYNRAVEKFKPLHVSLYHAATGWEFMTSDNPVVLARDDTLLHVGMHNGLALGDANFIFLPITRTVATCLTQKPEGDLELSAMWTQRMNQTTWRNAVRRIAFHPSLADWRRTCNVPRRQA